ncbi:IS30 family transposase [Oceanivirga miroungae]|nr:IS30 family transposase [Oceanivirga miroungae]
MQHFGIQERVKMKLKDRIEIEIRLRENTGIREIARLLNVNPSTVSREIKKNRMVCRNKKVIELNYRDNEEILETHPCELLTKSPNVCNGCPRYINNHCYYHYVIYNAEQADNNYLKLKSESNSKIKNEVVQIELKKDIQKLLNLGQPISHIHISLKEIYKDDMVSIQTIYDWISKGIVKYTKKKIKTRATNLSKDKIEYKKRLEFLKNKEFQDFVEYTKGKNLNIVEMDLVCGPLGSNGYILTIFIPRIQFLMAYKLKYKTPYEVLRVLDDIENKIGYSMFKKLFGVILTDRGSEFLKFNEIEISKKTLKNRTKIFYCDAGTPTQKPFIENIHRLLRKVYPKGVSLENVSQEDLYEVVSNINSLKKKAYNNKTPNDMFIETYSKTLLSKLSLRAYNCDEVVLLPLNTTSK